MDQSKGTSGDKLHVLICGAGICGLSLAIALHKFKGEQVSIDII